MLLLASTSTTSDSTYSCARGASSWSITLCISRKRGSEAVRINELVLGSAWMPPPVLGWAEALTEGLLLPLLPLLEVLALLLPDVMPDEKPPELSPPVLALLPP